MDVNGFTVELAKSLEKESLNKAIPPKLYYRLRRFLQMAHPKHISSPQAHAAIASAVHQKAEEIQVLRDLKKNEFMASVYDSGSVKLDFGSGVPAEVKKAAMAWAKKKGLKATEASLDKSSVSGSSVMFASGTGTGGFCVKRVKWEIEE